MDIKDRIQKLLALAESPVENEAQQAMLKARALMAEHKLSLADLEQKPDQEVIYYETQVSFTKRSGSWVPLLADEIAKNYCCRELHFREKGKQMSYIKLVGFMEDVEACSVVFRYAYDCVKDWNAATARKLKSMGYPAAYINNVTESYAWGFIRGIRSMYIEQSQNNQEWGLVLVIPQQVQEVVNKYKASKFSPKAKQIDSVFNQGFADGHKFSPETKLTDKSTKDLVSCIKENNYV